MAVGIHAFEESLFMSVASGCGMLKVAERIYKWCDSPEHQYELLVQRGVSVDQGRLGLHGDVRGMYYPESQI
jgi:hypothetical protein